MKVENEQLVVEVRPTDSVHGAKPEPEERPVDRDMATQVPIFLGGHTEAVPEGTPMLKGKLTVVTNVAEARNLLLNRCTSCKHFNHARWLRNWNHWSQSADPVHKASRDVFIGAMAEKDDPEAYIRQMGVCDKWTDVGVAHGLSAHDAMLLTGPMDRCTTIYHPPVWKGGQLDSEEPYYEARDQATEKDRLARSELLMKVASDASKADRG